eukprot:1444905-Rhodomonas_salina.3
MAVNVQYQRTLCRARYNSYYEPQYLVAAASLRQYRTSSSGGAILMMVLSTKKDKRSQHIVTQRGFKMLP